MPHQELPEDLFFIAQEERERDRRRSVAAALALLGGVNVLLASLVEHNTELTPQLMLNLGITLASMFYLKCCDQEEILIHGM